MSLNSLHEKMRRQLAAVALAVAMLCGCGVASASLVYDYSGSAVAIPDNNASGAAFAFSLSDSATYINSLTVTLNISGGYNGDLYVYLSHGSGFAVLLNRVGVGASSSSGYANTGFNVTFDAAASANVHFYQNNSPSYNGSGQLTGTWQPDGRGIDPASAPSAFDTASTTTNFSTFTGLNPNGDWTLFVSDVSAGAISTLSDFTVSVSAVPEPTNGALAIFAGIVACVGLWCRVRTTRRRAEDK
jgi:subtilisin-like proprotein convertase family protein